MVVRRRNSLTPHYIPLAQFLGQPRPRGRLTREMESGVSRSGRRAAQVGHDGETSPTSSTRVDEVISRSRSRSEKVLTAIWR
jgi:hypothetical protein